MEQSTYKTIMNLCKGGFIKSNFKAFTLIVGHGTIIKVNNTYFKHEIIEHVKFYNSMSFLKSTTSYINEHP